MDGVETLPADSLEITLKVTDVVRDRLEVLAKEIKEYDQHADVLVGEFLWLKVKIGERLIEAKALLPHGSFLRWGMTEFGWTPQHLRRHMELGRNGTRVSLLPPGTSLRAALAALRDDDPVDDEGLGGDATEVAERKSHEEAHEERAAAFEALDVEADGLPLDRIVRQDCDAFLDALPPACAHLCVTSPPYWAKRTYQDGEGELGQEREPGAFVERLCDTVDRIGRVLVPGGLLFLVMGDTYASQPGRYRGDPKRRRGISDQAVKANGTAIEGRQVDVPTKSLVSIPWRVLLELTTNRGWRCANVVAWVKPNHAPENVHDRFTQTWEPILVLTRAEHAYLRRDALGDTGDTWEPTTEEAGGWDVWRLAAGRGGAAAGHLAPFPEWLVARAIAAACPPGGIVLDPFAGSGTTLEVAGKLGARFLGCDLAPQEAPA